MSSGRTWALSIVVSRRGMDAGNLVLGTIFIIAGFFSENGIKKTGTAPQGSGSRSADSRLIRGAIRQQSKVIPMAQSKDPARRKNLMSRPCGGGNT